MSATTANFSQIATPEQYLGYTYADEHGTTIGNKQGYSPGETVDYTLPPTLQNNTVYLSGKWYNANNSMIAEGDSEILLIYKAKSVNVVAQGNGSMITIDLDGKALTQAYLGSDDVLYPAGAIATISMARLYNVVDGPSYGWHELEIIASPGFRIYTFTFG